jgi:hypothetical protein
MNDNEPTLTNEFSVCQFFASGGHEYVYRFVSAEKALMAAYRYTHNASAIAGLTSRVIITDGGDCCVFEWKFGEGVVFPEEQQIKGAGLRDYGKDTT